MHIFPMMKDNQFEFVRINGDVCYDSITIYCTGIKI